MNTGKKILVVDDVGINRLIPGMILRPFGYEVLEVSDGLEAIAVLDDVTVDLVLLDLTMPGLTGLDVLAAQNKKTESPRPIFVAYTAIASDAQAQFLIDSGFERVLKKPAKTISLLNMVREILR